MEFNDGTVCLGSHVKKFPTLLETVRKVLPWKINCAQIYLGSSRGYSVSKTTEKDILLTRNLVEYALFNVYVHSCLLYNLNGGTHIDNIDELIKKSKTEKQKEKFLKQKVNIPNNYNKTINGLVEELDICVKAFGTGVVVHIGSGTIKNKAIKRIAKTIEIVLSTQVDNVDIKKRHLILENAAGEGDKIGSTLEEIRDILDRIDKKYHPQISICIDTCHLYAAGDYDIERVSEVKRFFKDFDKLFGIDKLKLIHLNDSKGPFGCKKDRHANLGYGYIFSSDEGKRSLKFLVNFCVSTSHIYLKRISSERCSSKCISKRRIDMILETPIPSVKEIILHGLFGGDECLGDIDLVYSLV